MCLEKWPAESLGCEGTRNITMPVHSREVTASVTLQWRCLQRHSLCYKHICSCMCVCVCVCVFSQTQGTRETQLYEKLWCWKGKRKNNQSRMEDIEETEAGKEWACIPEGYEVHKFMAGHLHEPRSRELRRGPCPLEDGQRELWGWLSHHTSPENLTSPQL